MFLKLIKKIIYTNAFFLGLLIYFFSKKTPGFGHQGMIRLFCETRGHSNDLFNTFIGLIKKPYDFGKAEGILGEISGQKRENILLNLRTHGYHIFDATLSEELCSNLLAFATSHPCKMRPMDGEGPEKARKVVYPQGKPETVRYEFTTQDLIDNKDFQLLLADISLSAVAQEYLGAKPIIDVLGLWWHTAYTDKPDKDAAQYYHFDMDRLKWLKFFIYLTDVTTDNGPHMFVQGSHKTGGIPASMLQKGYARLTDAEVENHYGRDKIIEFVAPRGTIIAEDTRGLHKGKHVKSGDRLILQIQFSNSLFGADLPKVKLTGNLDAKLESAIQKYPDLYSRYI